MNQYRCIKQNLYHEDIGKYVSYGVHVQRDDIMVSDVSCDMKVVLHIVELLNQHKVSRLHMKDVIEDLLAEVFSLTNF